ncbi:MAG: YjbQ family protein [Erysipelotrichia bacterium]|nr:YjbQ family protein [Erysipelotrichia bacterium]
MIYEEIVKTPSQQGFVNVTTIIKKAVRASGIKNGHILVSVPHTTAALTVNENADPDVVTDFLRRLESAYPVHDPADLHSEGNSAAHVKSSLLGTCHNFIVADNELVLGTWQGIFLCEFDGPRTRRLIISIL